MAGAVDTVKTTRSQAHLIETIESKRRHLDLVWRTYGTEAFWGFRTFQRDHHGLFLPASLIQVSFDPQFLPGTIAGLRKLHSVFRRMGAL